METLVVAGNESKSKVLIVEDNDSIRLNLRITINRLGYEVFEAKDAEEARKLLDSTAFDLILLDQLLPDSTGLKLVGEYAEKRRRLKFIIMTSYGDVKLATEAMKLGAYDYLTKDKDFLKYIPGVIERTLKVIANENELALANEKLKLSEQKYKRIFDNFTDILYQTSLDGRIIEITPSVEKYGFSRQEMIGKNILDFYFYPEYRDILKKNILEFGELTDYEVLAKLKDGKSIYTSISAKLVNDSKGNPAYIEGTIRNIDLRKKSEIELMTAKKKSEEQDLRYRTLFNNAPIGLVLFDSNGIVSEVNPTMLSLLGSPSEEKSKGINVFSLKNLIDSGFSDNARKCINEKSEITATAQYISIWGVQKNFRYHLVPIIINDVVDHVVAYFVDVCDCDE